MSTAVFLYPIRCYCVDDITFNFLHCTERVNQLDRHSTCQKLLKAFKPFILFSLKTIQTNDVLSITDENSFDLDCRGNISLG